MPTNAQIAAFNQNLVNFNASKGVALPNNGAISTAHPDGINYGSAPAANYNDPYTPTSYTSKTGGGSYSTQAAADAADNAYYNGLVDQTNGQLGQLDNQQNIGLGNIGNAYNSSLNTLLGTQDQAQRDYNSNKAQGLQDYTQSRGQNQFQTGQQANGLQRLLGAHGYSGSANGAAGYAAALQGTQQAQGLDTTYGRNMQALDTNFGDFQGQIKNKRGELDQQRYAQENGLKAQVQTNRQGLLSQLAQIAQARGNGTAASGYESQANALNGQITALGQQYANPVLQVTAPTYQAPSLDSYTLNPNTPGQINQPGAAGNISPFFQTLLGQDKKKGLGIA